jgi:hypothetical protein
VLERLYGLLLILAGVACLALVVTAQQHGWFQPKLPGPLPGTGNLAVPIITPLSCFYPLAAIGSLGLCIVGVRKLLAPDDWRPPKHLGK